MDMRSKLRGFCVVLAGMGLMASSLDLRAATVTLPAVQDATLFGGNDANSNVSLADPGIFVGTDSTPNAKRGLIEFNIAQYVPAGATITSVSLQLTVGQAAGTSGNGGTLSSATTIGLFDESQAWGQPMNVPNSTMFMGMGQGQPAQTGDATWSEPFYNSMTPTQWNTPGGDWTSSLMASASASSTGSPAAVTWSSAVMMNAMMVSDVQNWLNNPSTNYGWLLKNSNETATKDYLAFWSAQGAAASMNSALAPALTVTYTPVPEPTSLMLITLCLPILTSRRRPRAGAK
jgi:hypothetical protein